MKNIINKNKFQYLCILALIITIVCIGIFSFIPFSRTGITNANFEASSNSKIKDVFVNEKIDDGKFVINMSATHRRQTTFPKVEKTVTTNTGKEIKYICFNWSDLKKLNFKFSSTIATNPRIFTSCEFLVTYVQTEDIKTSMGTGKTKTLYQSDISNNTFMPVEYTYNIDKNATTETSQTVSNGNGFGIYKFDFRYNYYEKENEITVSTGEIYVAIIPDNIDEISAQGIQIDYKISSSNKLMNIFHLSLSTDAFKYVNPEYLIWEVVGRDKDNVHYVLTNQMIKENPNYTGFSVVWPGVWENVTGNNFTFDSNDIEGTWKICCKIKNKDGSEKAIIALDNVSTIKYQEPSYVWVILVSVFGFIIIIGLIILLLTYIKHNKK